MTKENVRAQIKEVIRGKIGDFEQFKKTAQRELQELPDDDKLLIEQSLADPEFEKRYIDLLTAYEEAITQRQITAPQELISDDTIKQFSRNLAERGFNLDYESEPGKKKLKVRIDSGFLRALATLISKIAGLF